MNVYPTRSQATEGISDGPRGDGLYGFIPNIESNSIPLRTEGAHSVVNDSGQSFYWHSSPEPEVITLPTPRRRPTGPKAQPGRGSTSWMPPQWDQEQRAGIPVLTSVARRTSQRPQTAAQALYARVLSRQQMASSSLDASSGQLERMGSQSPWMKQPQPVPVGLSDPQLVQSLETYDGRQASGAPSHEASPAPENDIPSPQIEVFPYTGQTTESVNEHPLSATLSEGASFIMFTPQEALRPSPQPQTDLQVSYAPQPLPMSRRSPYASVSAPVPAPLPLSPATTDRSASTNLSGFTLPGGLSSTYTSSPVSQSQGQSGETAQSWSMRQEASPFVVTPPGVTGTYAAEVAVPVVSMVYPTTTVPDVSTVYPQRPAAQTTLVPDNPPANSGFVQPPGGIPEIGNREWQTQLVQPPVPVPMTNPWGYVSPDQLLAAQVAQGPEPVVVQEPLDPEPKAENSADATAEKAGPSSAGCDHVKKSIYNPCGVLLSILVYPLSLLCCMKDSMKDREVRCVKCGEVIEQGYLLI